MLQVTWAWPVAWGAVVSLSLHHSHPTQRRGESAAEPAWGLIKQPPLRVEGRKFNLGDRFHETKMAISC
jgi:hypothetical protein